MTEVRRSAHYDAAERKFIFELRQDVEPLIDQNAAIRKEQQKGDFRHTWSLDNVTLTRLYYEYCPPGMVKPMDQEFWQFVDKRIKSDPDYSKFRTYERAMSYRIGYR